MDARRADSYPFRRDGFAAAIDAPKQIVKIVHRLRIIVEVVDDVIERPFGFLRLLGSAERQWLRLGHHHRDGWNGRGRRVRLEWPVHDLTPFSMRLTKPASVDSNIVIPAKLALSAPSSGQAATHFRQTMQSSIMICGVFTSSAISLI